MFPEAFACFQSLVNRRPGLSEAWAGMAMAFVDEHMFHEGDGESLNRASGGRKGIGVGQPERAGDAALTRVQYYSGDPAFAYGGTNGRARFGNPETLALVGVLLAAYGDTVHATELLYRAYELSPELPSFMFGLGYVYAYLVESEGCAALPLAQRTRCAELVHFPYGHRGCSRPVRRQGRTAAEARARLLALSPQFEADLPGLIAVWRFGSRDYTAPC